jgi:hypothetical protein
MVSGFTMMSASAQRDQSCRCGTQNNRSDPPKRGRDRFRLSTPSCWRRASTSRAVSAAADEHPNHDQESEEECENGSTVVAHRNAAETGPALCAQAVEFRAGPLLATHSHFSDVPPRIPDPYRRHSQQPRGPGALDREPQLVFATPPSPRSSRAVQIPKTT